MGIHALFRLRFAGKRMPCNLCAVFHRSQGQGDVGNVDVIGKRCYDGLGPEQRRVEQPVLVAVGQLTQHPEAMVRELLPSMVRLQSLDDCLRVWMDAPDLVHAFVQELISVFEDGELRFFRDAFGQGDASMGDCKVIDKVVECRAHIVETVPDEQAEFGWWLPEDFDLDDLGSSLRIEFGVNTVRAWFEPPTAFGFKALQVLPGPFYRVVQ